MSAALRMAGDRHVQTSVVLPAATVRTLRAAAAARTIREGGRFSISREIADLVARHLAAPACDAAPIQQEEHDDRRSR
jgi:hypothetical protein